MRHKIVNTFGGLDTDTSINKYSNEKYVECKNFRVLLNEENGSHSLINIKNNKTLLTFTFSIIGIGEFTDTLVIFADNESNTHVYTISKDSLLTDNVVPVKIFETQLWGYTSDTKLRVICREETTQLKKVYFTDGRSTIRFFNIEDDLTTLDLNTFEMSPDFKVSPIGLTLSTGSIKAGKVGYSYQLYNTYGAQTKYTPVSELINIFNSPLTKVRKVRGSNIGDITSKGVEVRINDIDPTFDRIRLARIHYESVNLEPSIQIIDESSYTNSYSFLDIGIAGLEEFTVEEFNELLLTPIPKTLESKNNYLFLGNVKDNILDVNWDNTTVEITSATKTIKLDEIASAAIPHGETVNADTTTYANSEIASKFVGYQRKERYRFGIVGFNSKMNPTFVKSVEDFIFPDSPITSLFAGNVNTNILHPKFTITNIPNEVKYIQVVRVERTAEKRSVVDSGIVGRLQRNIEDSSVDLQFNSQIDTVSPIASESNLNKIYEYTSPEILYNKKYDADGNILEVSAVYVKLNNSNYTVIQGNQNSQVVHSRNYTTASMFIPTTSQWSINEQAVYISNQDLESVISIGGVTVISKAVGIDGRLGVKGTCMLINTNDDIQFTTLPNPNPVLCRRRKNLDSNGNPTNFYGNLEANQYVACSPLIPVVNGQVNNSQPFDVFGGDTFISMFENLRVTWTEEAAQGNKVVVNHVFPIESTINLALTVNPTMDNLRNANQNVAGALFRAMQEKAGVYTFQTELPYTQDFNLYTYNSVYSRNNNITPYFVKPADIKFENINRSRVYYTDKKVNGEFSDSWLKVRPNNFIDLDIRYGEITRLYNFKDTLYAFQTEGVCVIPVEQRELIQTSTPGPLVAGLGDAVSAPFYLSGESGLSDYNGITNSKNAIYYYDRKNNKICRVEETIKFLSDEMNISSLLLKTKSRLKNNVSTAFDKKHNEVLFNLADTSIVFSEYKQMFIGEYEYSFIDTLSVDDRLILVNFTDVDRAYENYTGNNNSSITLLLNPQGNQSVVYDVFEVTNEVYNNVTLLPNEPIYSIRCWNEYQDTGEILLKDNDNFIQRFRTWRLNTLVDNTPDEGRLRSNHLFVKLVFRNTENIKCILHDVVTSIRLTKVR